MSLSLHMSIVPNRSDDVLMDKARRVSKVSEQERLSARSSLMISPVVSNVSTITTSPHSAATFLQF
eukprot:6343551-Amphidinium_carterae.1